MTGDTRYPLKALATQLLLTRARLMSCRKDPVAIREAIEMAHDFFTRNLEVATEDLHTLFDPPPAEKGGLDELLTLEEAARLVRTGRPLLVAGDEALLAALPRGRWIGGTSPFFSAAGGSGRAPGRLHVTRFPDEAREARVVRYGPDALHHLPADYPENGVSFIILPAGSRALQAFAQHAPSYRGLFARPLAGWVAGVDPEAPGPAAAAVADGASDEPTSEGAVVLHLTLPPGRTAELKTLNLFRPGEGDAITFPRSGFSATEATVNGVRVSFAAYLAERGVDTRLPLVADYQGAQVNVSIQGVDAAAGTVRFFAPVFEDVTYRVARTLDEDYPRALRRELERRQATPLFACNCVLNYLYGGLEGKRTALHGPYTFGEVAYQLLNQTAVYVELRQGE